MKSVGTAIRVAGVTLVLAAVGSAEAQECIPSQWANSPHARSMDTPDEQERMNRTGCAHCHTAQGFQEVILAGAESTAPYQDPTGLTCEACHEVSPGEGQAGPLRAGAVKDACRGCHDELVANRPDYLSWCSQWGVFEGSGGMEIPGMEYAISMHSDLEKGCVSCHMAAAAGDADPDRVGGHTFRVKTKGETPVAFNPGGCISCHGEMTLDRVEASQEEVRSLLFTLAALLPQKTAPDDSASTEPRYPSDPSLDEVEARASHNYWLVQKDGSFGVHNPMYTRVLLFRSISELREMRGAIRAEVGPEPIAPPPSSEREQRPMIRVQGNSEPRSPSQHGIGSPRTGPDPP